MDFIKHQKDLQQLLRTQGGKYYAGLYVYNRGREEESHVYKIGMSEAGLYKRLKSTKACYVFPGEYIIDMVIVMKHETTKEGIKTIRFLEKALHQATKHLSTELQESKEQGRRPTEWRLFANRAKLNAVVKEMLNKHRELWDHVIVFGSKGWHIVRNNRLSKRAPITLKSLKPPGAAYTKKPTLKSMPVNRSHIKIPTSVKVGDVIKSNNWEAFTVVKILGTRKVQAQFKHDKRIYTIEY
jgi:hypothetical protein